MTEWPYPNWSAMSGHAHQGQMTKWPYPAGRQCLVTALALALVLVLVGRQVRCRWLAGKFDAGWLAGRFRLVQALSGSLGGRFWLGRESVQVQVVALIVARLSGSAPLLSSWVAALAALAANHRQSHSMRRHGLFLPRV